MSEELGGTFAVRFGRCSESWKDRARELLGSRRWRASIASMISLFAVSRATAGINAMLHNVNLSIVNIVFIQLYMFLVKYNVKTFISRKRLN